MKVRWAFYIVSLFHSLMLCMKWNNQLPSGPHCVRCMVCLKSLWHQKESNFETQPKLLDVSDIIIEISDKFLNGWYGFFYHGEIKSMNKHKIDLKTYQWHSVKYDFYLDFLFNIKYLLDFWFRRLLIKWNHLELLEYFHVFDWRRASTKGAVFFKMRPFSWAWLWSELKCSSSFKQSHWDSNPGPTVGGRLC
jgi:hypothetical protein